MSPAEENAVRTSARNGWLLSTPALVMLAFAAAGPLADRRLVFLPDGERHRRRHPHLLGRGLEGHLPHL
jgi:hypothetical protein